MSCHVCAVGAEAIVQLCPACRMTGTRLHRTPGHENHLAAPHPEHCRRICAELRPVPIRKPDYLSTKKCKQRRSESKIILAHRNAKAAQTCACSDTCCSPKCRIAPFNRAVRSRQSLFKYGALSAGTPLAKPAGRVDDCASRAMQKSNCAECVTERVPTCWSEQ